MTEQAEASLALCCLLRATQDPAAANLPESIPWSHVVHLARRNAVAPLLYAAVQEGNLPVPEEDLKPLQQAYYAAAAMNARLFDGLERILERLAASGIPAIVLKGAALAETVYGNAALRPMADLDILVPRDLVPDTARILAPWGFLARPGPPGHSFDYEAHYSGEISLHHGPEAGGLTLDVHWHLLAHQWLHHTTRLNVDALWRSAKPLSVSSSSTRQLCAEDMVIHLCLHAAFGQAYAYLLNLVDVDRSVRAYNGLDWLRLVERAAAFQVRVPVYFGLCYSVDLLGTPIPETALSALRPGAIRQWKVNHLAHPRQTALRGRPSLATSRRYLLHLALVDSLPGWSRFARFLLWPGDAWLAARYRLSQPAAIRRAQLWHPVRVLAASLGALLQPLRRVGRQQ